MSENLNSVVTDPSLQAGSVLPTDPAEIFRASMSEVTPMLGGSEEEYQAWVPGFVERRAQELSGQHTGNGVGRMHGGSEDFIGPHVPMIMSALLNNPYYLDDNRAYEEAFPALRACYQDLISRMSPERAYLNATVVAANLGQVRYFESVYGNPRARANLSRDIIDDDIDGGPTSIAEFKRVAVCQERAGVAHNTLKILGVNSKLESGVLTVEKGDQTITEPHAFIVITTPEGKHILFDPTNPVIIKDAEGVIIKTRPNKFEIEPGATEARTVLKEMTAQPDGSKQDSAQYNLVYTLES